MFLKQKRFFWVFVWLLILALGPITVLKITPISLVLRTPSVVVPFLQRITGLLAFSLLFVQIILGAFMNRWTEKLGGWVFNFHQAQGAIVYSLILAHPLLFVLFNFKLKGVLDPFYVFTDFCLLCPKPIELWYTFGRVSFWLISVAILAVILKNEPWWRTNWRKFHILNYVAFLLAATHSFFVGTDTKNIPFSYFYWFALATVVFSLIYKFVYLRIKKG